MFKKYQTLLIGLLVALIVIVPVFLAMRSPTVIINDSKIRVERAISENDRQVGLGKHKSLKPNHGMLFEFEESDLHGIWMKEVEFPIDVLWLNSKKEVIHIEADMQPSANPPTFYPDEPALYVLELPAGFVSENKIKEGQRAEFNY